MSVSSFKFLVSSVVIVGLEPPTSILPVPSGPNVIFWLAPFVIVIKPDAVFPVINVTFVFPLDLNCPSLPVVPVAKAVAFDLHSPGFPLLPYHKNLCSLPSSFITIPPWSAAVLPRLTPFPLPSTFNSSVGSLIFSSVTSK